MKSGFHINIPLLAVLFMGCVSNSERSNPLLGSWSIEKVEWISEDTTVVRTPQQKGLLLITPDRYSICWSPLEVERTPFQNLSNPSQEEILDGFNSIVFNTGSYTFSETKFSTEAHMAKVPGFEGGSQHYSYKVIDNQLILTLFDETYPGGKKPNWYGKWRTRFSLARIPPDKTD